MRPFLQRINMKAALRPPAAHDRKYLGAAAIGQNPAHLGLDTIALQTI